MKLRLLPPVLILSLALPFQVWAAFSDVPDLNPHKAAIESLTAAGVLTGYPDGSFKPDQDVNRAEALKIILVGLGIDTTASEGSNFSDVKSSDWFDPYVATGVKLGIVKGYDDGTFKPQQTVNRAEATKMALLAAERSLNKPSENPFPDVSTDAWFASVALEAKTTNIVPPQFDGDWHPETLLSRAKISELVYRLREVKASGAAFEESKNWLVKDFATVDLKMKVPFSWGTKTDGVGAIWLLDAENSQFSMLSPYPNGATLLMTRFSNGAGLSQKAMFNSLHASLADFTEEVTVNGLPAIRARSSDPKIYREWYVYLPNSRLVHFEALRGQGAYSPYLESAMDAIVNSIEFKASASGLSNDEALEALRSAIQVDGAGTEAKSLVTDWKLIETDAVGVGTGPVDYFYSPALNVTIKFERHFDVILDLREGETSAF